MSNSRAPPPPVNLKERIAALEQRNALTSPRAVSPVDQLSTPPKSAGLRDKIAKFEKKGGVPVPRGSFGLGAPPLAENAPQKRRGELYGNRIPVAARVASGPPITRTGPSGETFRSFSTSAMDFKTDGDDDDDDDGNDPDSPQELSSPFLGLSAHHIEGKEPTPRGTSFRAALGMAQQLESPIKTDGNHETAAPSSGEDLPEENKDTAQMVQPPISIVVSSVGEAVSPTAPSEDLDATDSSGEQSPTASDTTADQIQETDSTRTISPEPLSNPSLETLTPTTDSVFTSPEALSDLTPQVNNALADDTATLPATPDGQTLALPKSSNLAVEIRSPELSPAGPLTVEDLGKMVAHMQSMFSDQISPLVTPKAVTPLETQEQVPSNQVIENPELFEHTMNGLSATSAPEAQSAATETNKKAAALAPRTNLARPATMFESVTGPQTDSRFFQSSTSQLDNKDYDQFPLIPEANNAKFAPVTSQGRKKSSVSSPVNTSRRQTFSAVVYDKVAEELPRSDSLNALASFYSTHNPQTPQTNKTGPPMLNELPLSPGFRELSSLLQDAALLEESLESGTLPGESTAKQEEPEKEVWVEEQPTSAKSSGELTHTESRVKENSPTCKTKSRNPTLRSKTWRKDGSSKEVHHANAARTKSVFLSFLTSATNHQQSTSSASRQSSHAPAPGPHECDADAMSQKSTSTTPKSPRGYFATLRRLASSGSRSSISGGHSRHSVSTSSEMSSEDSGSLPTPPGCADSLNASQEMGWNAGVDVKWPAVSPTKASTISRAASFMWGRSRTRSTMSATTASASYESIDRLSKSAATKSAVTLLPPLESLSYDYDLSELPSGPPRVITPPLRSSSHYSGHPSDERRGLDAAFAKSLSSPTFSLEQEAAVITTATKARAAAAGFLQPPDEGLIPSKPASPIYTPHTTQSMTIPDLFLNQDRPPTPPAKNGSSCTKLSPLPPLPPPSPSSPSPASFLRTSAGAGGGGGGGTRDSWVSVDSSMDASMISERLVDSFPSVPPRELPGVLSSLGGGGSGGRSRSNTRPTTLPPLSATSSSFLEAPSPLSTAGAGAEFFSPGVGMRRSMSTAATGLSGS